jgi:uncharacterized membrane protein (UPF0182 family)
MSAITKKYRVWALILTIASVLLTLAPACVFVVQGFIYSDLVIEKVALTGTVMVAVIGSLLCLMSRTIKFRSRLWLVLLALFFILDHFTVIILVFALTQTFDELVVAPIAHHCRAKYSINREIDKRGA